jgi:uncharacterized protein (DUF58 family)
VRVVLDLTTPTDLLQCEKDGRLMEEAAISLCASLLVEAEKQEQEIALTVLGLPLLKDVGLHSGQRHLGRLLASLSRINLDGVRATLRIKTATSRKKVGFIVVRPDRERPSKTSRDVRYFSGEQLAELQVRAQWSESA